MKVLLTGGAGFIGSYIAQELIKRDIETVIIDNLLTGNKKRIPVGSVFYQADICKNLDDIFVREKPDIVIHQAAQVSVKKSLEDPVNDADKNLIGTINLLNHCVHHKTKKFIFASSAALYGNPQYLPIDEKHPAVPVSPYGLSKYCAELYIQLYSKLFGLRYTILRYSNVFGGGQSVNGEAGVIAIFMNNLLNGGNINIFGDGFQTRDFIYVKDVATANIAALTHADNEILNISTQTKVSLLETVKVLGELLKASVTPNFLNEREGDIKESTLSNKRAIQLLNWKPEHSFTAGLRETAIYYKE